MPTEIKGTAKCPECGSEQNVKHDGRKFFITCSECRTITSYQAAAAKERIIKRIKLVDNKPVDAETVSEPKEETPKKEKLPPTPARVTTTSFFDHLNELF